MLDEKTREKLKKQARARHKKKQEEARNYDFLEEKKDKNGNTYFEEKNKTIVPKSNLVFDFNNPSKVNVEKDKSKPTLTFNQFKKETDKSNEVWTPEYFKTAKEKAEKTTSLGFAPDVRFNAFVDNVKKLDQKANKYINGGYSTEGDNIRREYSDLRQEAIEFLRDINSKKERIVSNYSQEYFDSLVSSLNESISTLKTDGDLIVSKRDEINRLKTDEEKTNYNNNYAKSKYGTTMNYSQWKTAKAQNKDKNDVGFLNGYAIDYGYKDDAFAKDYVADLQGQIAKLKEQKKVKYKVSAKGEAIPIKQDNSAVNAQIETLQNRLNEFNEKRNAYTTEKNDVKEFKTTAKKIRSNVDYEKTVEGVDFEKYFEGMHQYGYDKFIAGGRSGDTSGTWMKDMPEYFLGDFDGFSDINFDAFTKKQRKDLIYLAKQVGKAKNEFKQKVEKGEITVSEGSYNYAEEEYLSSYVDEFKSYVEKCSKTNNFKEKNQEKNYEALKNASGTGKFFTSATTVFAKPTADFLTAAGVVVDKVTKGEIDENSGWHALSNQINFERGAMTEGVKEEHGGIAGEAFGGALALADVLWASAISGGFTATGGSTKEIAMQLGKEAAKRSGIVMSTGAFSNTILDAKKRGLSDGQAITLGGIAAVVEYVTERMSFGRFFEALEGGGTKQIKSYLLNVLTAGLKSAPKEGAEEGITAIVNAIADTLIAGDKSNLKLVTQNYINAGYSEKDALKQSIFDNFIKQPFTEAVVGAAIGFVMGSGGSAVNYAQVRNYINSESAQARAKQVIINGDYVSTMATAKKYGASTTAFENSIAELETIADDSSLSKTEQESKYSSALKKAQTEFLRMEYCAESMEAMVKEGQEEKSKKTSITDLVKRISGKGAKSSTETSSVETQSEVVAENLIAEESNIDVIDDNGGVDAYTETNVSGREINDGVVAKDVIVRNNRLAKVNETSKSEVAKQDLTEHIDDRHYTDVYNKYVNVDTPHPSQTSSATPSPRGEGAVVDAVAKSVSVEERASEFNMIYDAGVNEDKIPKSKIFNDSQVREIYAAGRVDSELKFGNELQYDEVLYQLEEETLLEKYDKVLLNGILSMSASEIKQVAKRLGVNVEFVSRVPGNNPNNPGAYYNGTIYINENTSRPMQQVFLHELTHFFENADGYFDFQKTVFESKAFKRWLKTSTNVKTETFDSIDNFRHYLAEKYESVDADEINKEMVAYFVCDNMFQKKFGDLGRLATELTGTKKQKFISFMKNIFKKFSNAFSEFGQLEKKFLSLYDSALQNKNTDNNDGVKGMAIIEDENGNKFVKASRNIISGNDVRVWRKQITNFFNNLLEGKKSITIKTLEGDVLTITKKDTADKARDKYKSVNKKVVKMSNSEFRVKLNIESHIDEIVKISKSTNSKISKDTKSHDFAKDGFTYRTAFFEDYDGQLYKLTLSIGLDGNVATVYNVGRIKKRQSVARNKISVRSSNESAHDTLSSNSIADNSKNVKKNEKGSYMLDLNSKDTDYLKAVENGDMETAQKMVDEVAREKGYSKAYHGTKNKFTKFDEKFIGSATDEGVYGRGFYISTNKSESQQYGNILNLYFKDNVLLLNEFDSIEKLADYLDVSESILTTTYADNQKIIKPRLNFNGTFSRAVKEKGFVGVRIDYSTSNEIVIFDGKHLKSAEPVVYDDDGNVIPLSKRFDERQDDIRYMLDLNPEGFQDSGEYFDVDEDGELTWLSSDSVQRELKKNSKQAVIDKEQIEAKAKSMIKKYNIQLDSSEVATDLTEIYNSIKNIDDSGNHAKPKVEALSKKLTENMVSSDVVKSEDYDELMFYLEQGIIYDDFTKAEFGDDWNSFLKENRFRLHLKKRTAKTKNGLSIDEMYDQILREAPQFVTGEAQGPKGQLLELVSAYESVSGKNADDFIDAHFDEIVEQIQNEIYSGYAGVDFVKKGTEKAKAQANKRFEENSYMDSDTVLDMSRHIEKERRKINEQAFEKVEEIRKKFENGDISKREFEKRVIGVLSTASLNAKIKPLESYYRESFKYRDRYKKISDKTGKMMNELRTMMEHPSEGKYIPKDLIPLVEKVLKIGDNQNFNVADQFRRYVDAIKLSNDIDEDVRESFLNVIDTANDEASELYKVFAQIRDKYNSYKNGSAENSNSDSFEQQFYCYHEVVAQKLAQVADVLKDADMVKLTMRQAEALEEGLSSLLKFVKNSVYAEGMTQKAYISEVGRELIAETSATAIHDKLNPLINIELSPERMFNRLAGYKQDSAWSKVYEMLNDGQTKAKVIEHKLNDVLSPVMSGENFANAEKARSYKSEDLVDVGLETVEGEPVKITRGMMISLYLHLRNESNRNHAIKGGLEIPNLRKYYKGRVADSFAQGKQKVVIDNAIETVKKIEENLSEYDKMVVKTIATLFDVHTKKFYNEVSEDVFGFKKAKVKKYFPIYSSNDFTKSDFTVAFETTLKNLGNMKERQEGASNPIRLMDVFDVASKEIVNCAEYCGKLKAEMTFTRLYNTVTPELSTSLKNEIGKHFGESGKKYIENLIKDYSNTRRSESDVVGRFLQGLRGNVATGALLTNVSVTIKQAASYPTAAAVVGWKPLMKALAVSDNGAKVFYRANRDLIDRYTPWLRYRTEGYSSQEVADLKNSKGLAKVFNNPKYKWLFGWITATDVMTVGRLWQASEYYVQDNYTELTKGTDEYYKQVAKVFEKVVFETQPNYSAMQRPDILRSKDELVKSLVMFSTQPLQNLGILYDASANLAAQTKAFKKGEVDADVLKGAKQQMGRAVGSLLAAQGVFVLMTFIASALTGKIDDYLDEKGDLTFGSAFLKLLKDYGAAFASMVSFGGDIYEAAVSIISGETYYGMDVSNVQLISNAIESVKYAVDALFRNDDLSAQEKLAKVYSSVEKIALLCGVPLRNFKNTFFEPIKNFYNLVTKGDWYNLDEKRSNKQYYIQMYEYLLDGDSEKYNEAVEKFIEDGGSVTTFETGVRGVLIDEEYDDVLEAAQAFVDGDYTIYDEIVEELVSRGLPENLVIGAIDSVANGLADEELTDEEKKTKEQTKYSYQRRLLESVNYQGLTKEQKADVQDVITDVAEEYAHEQVTGEVKNVEYSKALKNASGISVTDYIVAKVLMQKEYSDVNKDGNVSTAEKVDAIDKSNVSATTKDLLKMMNIMGSKKIDTDKDGKTDTKFDDLPIDEQIEYVNANRDEIYQTLEDEIASKQKAEIKSEYKTNLESRINVFDYDEKYRATVQNELDYFSNAYADIQVKGDTESTTAKTMLHFDESGFIDLTDYIKYYTYSKDGEYTKNEEKLDVINGLDLDSTTKLRLKLWVVASGWSLDDDGDGKKEKRISSYEPEFIQNWIENNSSYIINNCSYWR